MDAGTICVLGSADFGGAVVWSPRCRAMGGAGPLGNVDNPARDPRRRFDGAYVPEVVFEDRGFGVEAAAEGTIIHGPSANKAGERGRASCQRARARAQLRRVFTRRELLGASAAALGVAALPSCGDEEYPRRAPEPEPGPDARILHGKVRRLAGNGGWFWSGGLFRAEGVGNVRAFLTRLGPTVVLHRKDGLPMLVSADDTDGFLRALKGITARRGWPTRPT